jgi:hypothetical protein
MEGMIISYPLAPVSYYDMNCKIILGSLGIPGMVPQNWGPSHAFNQPKCEQHRVAF